MAYSVKDAESLLQSLDLKIPMKSATLNKDLKLNRLSKLIGGDNNFLSRLLKTSDVRVSILFSLSTHLGLNLFEPYQKMLPEELQPTERERALQQQLTDLQSRYDALQRERDLLMQIAMKP